MASQRLQGYFDDYASYHRTPGNKATHLIGIPLIIIGILSILARLGMGGESPLPLDAAGVFWALASLWYIRLDWKLGIPFSAVTLGLYYIGRACSLPVAVSFFAAGWIFQLVGHYRFERNSPAFLNTLVHLFIGPFWIFSRVLGYR